MRSITNRFTRTARVARAARTTRVAKRSYTARGHSSLYAMSLVRQLQGLKIWPLPNELAAEQIMRHIQNVHAENGKFWMELDKTPDSPYTHLTTIECWLPDGEDGDHIESDATCLKDAMQKNM